MDDSDNLIHIYHNNASASGGFTFLSFEVE
jgi:hypothetical protein